MYKISTQQVSIVSPTPISFAGNYLPKYLVTYTTGPTGVKGKRSFLLFLPHDMKYATINLRHLKHAIMKTVTSNGNEIGCHRHTNESGASSNVYFTICKIHCHLKPQANTENLNKRQAFRKKIIEFNFSTAVMH